MIRPFAIALLLTLSLCCETGAAQPGRFSRHFSGHRALWAPHQYSISSWDPIFRHVAAEFDYDWRLLAAISHTESRFDPDIVSGAGAIGLMQVMPASAQRYGIPFDRAHDPLTNVWLGASVLSGIWDTLRFPHWMLERDRLAIVLASYNCGIGHVLDARRLALKYGENYNSWVVVSKYLTLLEDEAYFSDEEVVSGSFEGSAETLAFVSRVLRLYDRFCRRIQM